MKKASGSFLFVGWVFVLLGLLLSISGTQSANSTLALVGLFGACLFGLSAVILLIVTVAIIVALRANSAPPGTYDPTEHHNL